MKSKICTALLTAAALFTPLSLVAEKAQNPADAKRAAVEVFGKLPLSFEPTEDSARFLAHSGGYAVSVGVRESSVAVTDAKSGKTQTLHFAFDNANLAAPLQAIEPQPGVTNYYLGQDSSKWRLGVKNYKKIRAQGIYPGVDIVYYGDHRRLEFDFVVAPKADPSAIALSFSGMNKLSKDASGDLVAEVNGQPVHFVKPYAYQKVTGVSKPVAVDYELASAGSVHLRLGSYDRNSELIIDPVVSYATYLGGSQIDVANGIAVDKAGSAYITGQTCSNNFPLTTIPSPNLTGAFQGHCDAYVTKFSPDGSALAYTTILGGTIPNPADAQAYGIAVDNSGSPYANYAYIVGTTNIHDLPGVNVSAYRNAYPGGDTDAFIAILLPSGSLLRTTYLGGSGSDAGYGIAIDQAAPPNITVVGQACSQDFPGYNAFETKLEDCVAFITKLDNGFDIAPPIAWGASALSPTPAPPAGGAYFFSGFFGGQPTGPIPTAGAWMKFTSYPKGAIVTDIATPPNSQRALNAGTSGPYFAANPPSPAVPNWNGAQGGITPDGDINWENFGPSIAVTTNNFSQAYGVAVDSNGDAFVAGGTNTPYLTNPLWPCGNSGGSGAWVFKVSGVTGMCKFEWTLETTPTTFGLVPTDTSRAVAVDSSSRAYVVGTMGGAFKAPSKGYNSSVTGGLDAFLVRVNSNGSAIDYATFLGGSGDDQGLGVAVDGSFQPYVTGGTKSVDFPVINPLQDPNNNFVGLPLGGTENAFVAKFTTDGSALIFSAYLGGSQVDQGNAIAVDPTNLGNMYVAGNTTSSDLLLTLLTQPMTAPSYVPPQPTYLVTDPGDAFIAMIQGKSIPTVTVSPGTVTFPLQDVKTTSTALPVLFTIQGTSTVNIKSISFDNPEFGQHLAFGSGGGDSADCPPAGTIVPTAPLVVPTVTGCTVWVIFTPTSQGPQSGHLYIKDSATSVIHAINLTGQGAAPGDQITAANPFLFPPQTVSTSSTAKLVTLKNSGTGTLYISGITVTAIATEFSETDTCGGQLASGSSCTITVIFTPSAPGLRTGTLTITDNAPGSPHTINLQGSGVGVSAPAIAPITLTFAGQAIGSTSGSQQITLTNTASTSLNFPSSIAISGTNAGDFSQSSSCGAQIIGNGSCVVNVTFTPTALSGRTALLVFTDSAANSPQTVALSGSGISASGIVSLSPTTVAFGSVAVGTPSTTQTVTLTNSSTTSGLSINSISVTGANALDFVRTNTNSCPPLAIGASCKISLVFTASVATAEAATLTVNASASNSPQSVALTGTGVAAAAGSGSNNNYTLTSDSTGVSVTQGLTAVYNFSVAPLSGFKNLIAFTCSGPAGSNCSVSPTSLQMDGSTTSVVKLNVSTTGGNGVSAKSIPAGSSRSIFLAVLPFSMMGMLLISKRRGFWLVLLLVALCLAVGMVGCGSPKSASGTSSAALAPGSYQVTFTATSNGTTPVVQTLNLVVNKQ